jgi:uncharacterized protein (DUF983 family)
VLAEGGDDPTSAFNLLRSDGMECAACTEKSSHIDTPRDAQLVTVVVVVAVVTVAAVAAVVAVVAVVAVAAVAAFHEDGNEDVTA